MPPSVESVIRGAPLALLALAVPIVGLAAGSLFERPTEEEKDESEQEAVRRSMLLRDMIDILRRSEDYNGTATVKSMRCNIVGKSGSSGPDFAFESV